MAEYKVNLSDNQRTITIPENVVDKDTTSIALVGHGQPNYGEPQNENFIHMLENFSSEDEPNMPIKGQLWFKQNSDGQTYELRICRVAATSIDETTGESNAVWDKVLKTSTTDEGEPINPASGDIWYDFDSHQLKVYDGALDQWNVIGPEDIVHTEEEHQEFISNTTSPSRYYVMDKSLFEKDIYNDEEETGHTGSLHLVTLKVLIKEVPNNGTGASESLKSCAMIYRFVVRAISTDNGFSISIFGAPNYEIIAKSDNLNFTTNLEVNAGNVVFTINNQSTSSGTYFVNGIDAEITRV